MSEGEGFLFVDIRKSARHDTQWGEPPSLELIAKLTTGDSVGLWGASWIAHDVVIESRRGDGFLGRTPKTELDQHGNFVADKHGQAIAFHACNIFVIWTCEGKKLGGDQK